ncbi:MAG: hypothetical protein MI784_00740 [Cytophagales bacterium]|nr:hypothetical protein [Cytophagales bacterium]
MNPSLKYFLAFLLCCLAVSPEVFSQDYDDMYFNSKDREAHVKEIKRKAQKKKEQMAQYLPNENYSANHVDPRIIAKYKRDARVADSLGLAEYTSEFDSAYMKKLLETSDFSMTEHAYQQTQSYSQPAQQNTHSNQSWLNAPISLSFGYGFGYPFGWGGSYLGFRYGNFYRPFMDPFSPYYDPFFDPYDAYYAYSPYYRRLAWEASFYHRFDYGYYGYYGFPSYRYHGHYPYWRGFPAYYVEGSRKTVRSGRIPSRTRTVRNGAYVVSPESNKSGLRSRYSRVTQPNSRTAPSSRNARVQSPQHSRTPARSRYSRTSTRTDRPTRQSIDTRSGRYSSGSNSSYSRPSNRSYSRSETQRPQRSSYSRSSSSPSRSSYTRSRSSSSSRSSYSRSSRSSNRSSTRTNRSRSTRH